MNRYSFLVEPEDAGCRLDVFVDDALADISRSYIQKLVGDGHVRVNGRCVSKHFKLRGGECIEIDIPEPVSLALLPEDIPLEILYEDDCLVVINKPQGMVVHPAPGHDSGTVVNALLHHIGPEALSGINGVMRPGIVHRIDKDTSGVLVIAKTDQAHQSLSAQLSSHSMRRVYTALIFRAPKADQFTINLPIGRNRHDRKKMAVITENAKPAITHVTVLERFSKYTLIEARLETGRTHQIRVHMSHLGYPLVGDRVYGPDKQPFAANGQFLHARLLGFVHPQSGQDMTFESPLPAHFARVLHGLGSAYACGTPEE